MRDRAAGPARSLGRGGVRRNRCDEAAIFADAVRPGRWRRGVRGCARAVVRRARRAHARDPGAISLEQDMIQPLDRRRFVAAGSAAIGALALPGCATTRTVPANAACLPPVLPARERLIRTVVGLRPYRAGGFVVREEQLGEAR